VRHSEVGARRFLLRPLARVPRVAGGAGARLRGDGPEDQNAVPLGGRTKKKIEQLAERLPEDAWSEVLPVEDTGERRPWHSGHAWSSPQTRRRG
jgi:hypothetical protein